MKKVLICGDRRWSDDFTIMKRMEKLPPDTVIVEGEADGADYHAKQCARDLRLSIIKVPANWDRYDKAAGPIRNSLMVSLLDPKTDEVWAFHKNLRRSKGTADTVRKAKKLGIKVEVIT